MDLLRGLTKRAPSSPGTAVAAAPSSGVDSSTESYIPGDRLISLSQDVYLEEERHQQALMALESSVLGCGSDDWSVDSDYAFAEFADDVKQRPLNVDRKSEGPPPSGAPTPGRSSPIPGTTPSSAGEVGRPKNDLDVGAALPLNERREAVADATSTPEEGGGACRGLLSPVMRASVGGENGENLPMGSSRDDPHHPGRHFGDPGSSTESAHILRLEQRMFLKAAFQLLEERDRLFPASIGSWSNVGATGALPMSSGGGDGGSNLRYNRDGFVNGGGVAAAGKAGEGARFHFQHASGPNPNRPRILKSGYLRKATARSVGRLEKTTWKTKYVELTPGSFAYSDHGPSVLGKSRSAKVIPLHQGFCTCRSVKGKHRVTRSRNSIILSNLAKPSTQHHRKGGRSYSGVEEVHGGGEGESSGTSKHLLEIEVVGLKRRVWAAGSKQECRRWVNAIKDAMTERPVDPTETVLEEDQLPIIPHDSCYRSHMERYLIARGFLRNATSTEDYLSALKGLMAIVKTGGGSQLERDGEAPTAMGVPVKWVKQQLPGSERIYQTSARSRGKSELAQLWKDMKRDTVSINGRVMTGEQGPEGIIGALTRCILAQAGRLPASDSLSKLSEAQSLLAARDVLLACDRTTSGGDTYLVVDNLCRNPALVVLVPASQEAEPLDISVTLHPRAAQAQARGQSPTKTSEQAEEPAAARRGSAASRYRSVGRHLEPPSPSSLASASATPSPPGGGQGSDWSRSDAHARKGIETVASPSGGDKLRSGDVAAAVPTARGRPRAFTRKGGAAASPMARGEASASPTSKGDAGAAGSAAASGGGGGGSGGRIFGSLSRRRSGEGLPGSPGRDRWRENPRKAQAALSARERGTGGKGVRTGSVMSGGLSSAPGNVQASYKMFFGDTDDAGDESGTSDDEDEGIRPRRSFIKVSCTARTSYKLFSSDPQDEERDVFAVVTGLFEQSFTISREFPSRSGSRSSGMGSATRTEGSLAFLTFNEPADRRTSSKDQPAAAVRHDSSAGQSAGAGLKTAIATEVDTRRIEAAAHVSLAEDVEHPAPGKAKAKTDHGTSLRDGSDENSEDNLDMSGPDSPVWHTPNRGLSSISGDEEEDKDEAGEGMGSRVSEGDDTSSATTARSKEDAPSRAPHPNGGAGITRRSPSPRKLLVRGEAEEGARVSKGYRLAQCDGDEDGAAADDGDMNLAATAALTPDSVSAMPFLSEIIAPRDRVGSIETPPSPAHGARVERKNSRFAGFLRRLSSREASDSVDALRLEPLEIDSDDDFGAGCT